MHELSIAISIVELAEQQARNSNAAHIEEVELEIGALAGVDAASLAFALESSVKNTLLENAQIVWHHIHGEGCCMDCNNVFPMKSTFFSCPACGSYVVKIVKGKEMRVKSITVNN
ncbi:MAG: hydrogenase maturation nickel metallochaperone HypA [Bacteroidales bacterium]|jgi:hydrogenase nickel incorporation protein HypA/HybF|nr:hydrogenase maturation nickel metallochaperone HypA [Bacteroidales bacterium]